MGSKICLINTTSLARASIKDAFCCSFCTLIPELNASKLVPQPVSNLVGFIILLEVLILEIHDQVQHLGWVLSDFDVIINCPFY